jgi:hypothetical protein
LAESKASQGQVQGAIEILALVLKQEAIEERDSDEAQHLYAKLKNEVSEKAFAQAEARGQTITLQEAVTQVLAQLYEGLADNYIPH